MSVGRRVFVEAHLAGVVDADDDQRLDAAGLDQLGRRLADAPVLALLKRRLGLEQVLPVMHVQHRVPQSVERSSNAVERRRPSYRRQPDEDVPIVLEKLGMKLFVTAELAIGRVHRRVRSV